MKKLVANLVLAYSAEHSKLKGTGFYITSILIGVFCPVFFLVVSLTEPSMPDNPENYYQAFVHEVLLMYTFFFLPLLIIINVSRITQLDHRNGGWQLMETQPFLKASIYFSKLGAVITCVLVSIVTMIGFCYLCAFVITLFQEVPVGVSQKFNATFVFHLVSRLLVASLFLIALQYFISVLIPSFIWSILIGFSGLMIFVFLNMIKISVNWYPHEIIGSIYRFKDGSDVGYWFTYTDILSLVLGILISFFGFQWYRFKRFRLAFLSRKRFLISSFVLVLGSAAVTYFLWPNEGTNHNRTVIQGEIDSEKSFSTCSVVSVDGIDTLAIIPIRNNMFKAVIPKDFVSNFYIFYVDDANFPVYMGSRDSISISLKLRGNIRTVKILGSRIAENNPQTRLKPIDGSGAYMIEGNKFLDQPEMISDILYEEWLEDLQVPEFKTVDNYIVREDFRDRNLQLLTVQYLNYWNDFMRRRRAAYDTAKNIIPDKIEIMKRKVSMYNEGLLSEPDYTKYILFELTSDIKGDIAASEKELQGISKLEPGRFKDILLFYVLRKALYYASDNPERSVLLDSHLSQFSNKKFSDILLGQSSIADGLIRGKHAPVFWAVTQDKKVITSETLKGKITVIDVWASWCSPCKQTSPYFDQLALKYSDDKVQFVALSTDEDAEAWTIEAKSHSKTVLQLRVVDHEKFLMSYGILGIPHFILLNADGTILNANMPSPTDSNFEIILKTELGIK